MLDTEPYPEDELLSASEALKVAHISRSTLLRAEKAGYITPFRTPGGHRRYRASDVRALISRPDERQATA